MRFFLPNIIYCFFIYTSLTAQTYEWTKSFGSHGAQDGRSLAIDTSGNIYCIGTFNGTVDFDPGINSTILSSVGARDIYILKLDSSGNFLWAKSFESTFASYAHCVTVDVSGNVYITGAFYDTVDFDPGNGISNLIAAGQRDAFIQKMDANGNFLWVRSFGGATDDISFYIDTDQNGNVFTTGYYNGTVDFDPGPNVTSLTSSGVENVYIHKMDSAGNFQWVRDIGNGLAITSSRSVHLDLSGNIYTSGIYLGIVDFDPGSGVSNLNSNGNQAGFVQKMDNDGNFIWARSFVGTAGSNSTSDAHEIGIDFQGNIYTVGAFYGTIDFDPGPGVNNLIFTNSASERFIFVQKMDSLGNFIWVRSFGEFILYHDFNIAVDSVGNTYVAARFHNTVDFDPGPWQTNYTSSGSADVFVQKLDSSGHFLWTRTFGGLDFEDLKAITLDNAGNIYTVGIYGGSVDFDPGLGSDIRTSTAGNYDVYIHKMSQCGINLGVDVISSFDGFTLSANHINASYQWLDCNNAYLPITGETNQNYSPIVNGSYAVEISNHNCIDTSACIDVSGLSADIIDGISEVRIFPNPASDKVHVNISSDYNYVHLYNVLGEKILSQQISKNEFEVDIENLPKGVYFANFFDNESNQYTCKIVKQ